MSLKHKFKILLQKLGLDIHRYNLIESKEYRIINFFNQKKIDCVLDVGANVGQYAIFIRQAGYENNIVSFEPSIEACKKLLSIAKSDHKWQIIPKLALGDIERELTLNISKNSFSSSLLQMLPLHKISAPDSIYIDQQMTKMERLDSLKSVDLGKYKNFFLKIDTQGYEDKVLDGTSKMMDRIIGLEIEMSIYPLYQDQILFRDLYDKILNLGFELWDLQRGWAGTDGKILQVDAIFFKK